VVTGHKAAFWPGYSLTPHSCNTQTTTEISTDASGSQHANTDSLKCSGEHCRISKKVPAQDGCCLSQAPEDPHCSVAGPVRANPSSQVNSQVVPQVSSTEGWEQFTAP